jgi:hypothetical protein
VRMLKERLEFSVHAASVLTGKDKHRMSWGNIS